MKKTKVVLQTWIQFYRLAMDNRATSGRQSQYPSLSNIPVSLDSPPVHANNQNQESFYKIVRERQVNIPKTMIKTCMSIQKNIITKWKYADMIQFLFLYLVINTQLICYHSFLISFHLDLQNEKLLIAEEPESLRVLFWIVFILY